VDEGTMGRALSPALAGKLAHLYALTATAVPFEAGRVVDTPWDQDAADQRVRKWASSDGSGDTDTVDYDKYERAFAAKNSDSPKDFGAFHLQHHDIEDGKLVVNKNGVVAAIAAVNGARGGYKGPSSKEALSHLERHAKEWREPEKKAMALPGGAEYVSGFRAEAQGNKGVLHLYGPIEAFDWFDDVVSAAAVKRWLDDNSRLTEIEYHLNSPGGSVFEGIAIYQLLCQHTARKTCIIDSVAASAASAVAMAADEILMPASSVMMVHGVSTVTRGGVREHEDAIGALQAASEALREIYMARTGKPAAEIEALMGRDTWLTAKQAVAHGFADRVIPAKSVKPPMSPSAFALLYPHSDARQIAAVFRGELPDLTQDQTAAAVPRPASPSAPNQPLDDGEQVMEHTMTSTLLLAKLGVSDEPAACAAVDAMNADRALLGSILSALEASPSEAEGKLLALKQAAERLPLVEAELASRVEADNKRHRNALVEQAKRERKITNEGLLAWALECPLNVLESFVQNASPVVPTQPIRPPVQEPMDHAGTWNGKSYGELSNMEKDQLSREHPALFNEMRELYLQTQGRR
jgi:ATP-dependent Clp protease protease subunit